MSTQKNADLPVLENWVGLTEAARRLGYSRQHVWRMASERAFTSLRRLEGADSTLLVSIAEIDGILSSRTPQESAESVESEPVIAE